MNKKLMLAIVLCLSVPAFGGPREEAGAALDAAAKAVESGDFKEATRQMKLSNKALERLRLLKRIEKMRKRLVDVQVAPLTDA